MMRQLRELDRMDRVGTARSARATPSRLGGMLVRAVLLVALLGAGSLVFLQQQLGWTVSLQGISPPGRLGSSAAGPTGEGGYVFASRQPGDRRQPVTYSPCKVIPVVVNDALAPAGTEGIVTESLAEVSRLTGLRFSSEGRTDDEPAARSGRDPGQPVLIAWTTPTQVPALEGTVAGLGGSTSVRGELSGSAHYVTGQVALDAPQLAGIMERNGGRALVRAIVLHELGHLVGLGHVTDPTQLMFAQTRGVLDFNGGDRRGLALVGSGTCTT